MAASILDRLTQLQAATRISAEKRGLSNAWTNEISIDVPEAGLSLGQIERVLKARLGHDEHIDGDLVRTESGGLALAVRGTGILPKSFTDKSGHLEALVNEAAEYIYGESEPGLFAKYLGDVDRGDEAIAFVKTHLQGASIAEQPILLNYWANAISAKAAPNATAEVLPLYQEAVRLKPDYWVGYNNLMLTLTELGDLEGVVRVGREMIKMSGGRPGKAPDDMYDLFDSALWDLRAQRAGVLADMMGTGGTTTTQSGAEGLRLAAIDARLHEPDTARLHLKTTVWNERSHADVALAASAHCGRARRFWCRRDGLGHLCRGLCRSDRCNILSKCDLLVCSNARKNRTGSEGRRCAERRWDNRFRRLLPDPGRRSGFAR